MPYIAAIRTDQPGRLNNADSTLTVSEVAQRGTFEVAADVANATVPDRIAGAQFAENCTTDAAARLRAAMTAAGFRRTFQASWRTERDNAGQFWMVADVEPAAVA